MAIFYRGAGIGTYWHTHDARQTGFIARAPQMHPTPDRLMLHIARGTVNSPFVSLTRSYGIALNYANFFGTEVPTPQHPAYVYEIEINEPIPSDLQLLDPIKEVAPILPPPLGINPPYQHDGGPDFLLGVVDPINMREFLTQQSPQPPASGGTPRTPNLSIALETLVRTLRDAEILAEGTIPAHCVNHRFEVY
ncbi:MAG: hypothetical protein OXL96_21795 [Candidatus Poribacteria bacterium]|nr:hypothetical protein [Candidatus Poribacteria bacterium]